MALLLPAARCYMALVCMRQGARRAERGIIFGLVFARRRNGQVRAFALRMCEGAVLAV